MYGKLWESGKTQPIYNFLEGEVVRGVYYENLRVLFNLEELNLFLVDTIHEHLKLIMKEITDLGLSEKRDTVDP